MALLFYILLAQLLFVCTVYAGIDELKIYKNNVTLNVEASIIATFYKLLANNTETNAFGKQIAIELNKNFAKTWYSITAANTTLDELEFEYEPNSLFWFSFRGRQFYLFRHSLESDCVTEDPTRTACKKIVTLNECVSNSMCGWCLQGTVGCDSHSFLKNGVCDHNTFEPISDNKTVEIQPNTTTPPQPIVTHLTEGMTRNITLVFSLLPHPLDLYYLMDFSGSMTSDKNNLIALASKLMTTLSNITTDYRLGLGSFVDKPMSPFGAENDYVFKNRMPLTANTSQFANIVSNTAVLNGADAPEAQGEAILQSAVCVKEIGWRNNSRRILLVVTDDDYHRAGDGARYNLTKPNDGLCHLNASGDYTESLTQDYPSVQQIKEALENNSITTILALKSRAINYWRNLTTIVKSVYIAELQSDSQNIIELITQEYDRIQSRLELETPKLQTNDLSVKYYSSCTNTTETELSICNNLPKTGTIKFVVSVSMKSCPQNPLDRTQTIRVSPVGLPLYVDIDATLVCGEQ